MAEFEIRPLHTLDDFRAVEDLQRVAWRTHGANKSARSAKMLSCAFIVINNFIYEARPPARNYYLNCTFSYVILPSYCEK